MIVINEITKSICTAVVALLIGLGAAEAQSSPSSAVVKDLAPSGTLRAAINAGNVVLVQKNARGELQGVTVDLARELAKRLAVPAALVEFAAAGKVTDAVKTGSWDVGFVAIEPKRAEVIDFTAPYVIIEGTYVAADNSPLRSIADVDREGIHIAVARGSAYDLYLSRTLQHATLLRYPTPPLALEGYVIDKIDVAAACGSNSTRSPNPIPVIG
jgi:polar amino acid transport system substrate-binding protein